MPLYREAQYSGGDDRQGMHRGDPFDGYQDHLDDLTLESNFEREFRFADNTMLPIKQYCCVCGEAFMTDNEDVLECKQHREDFGISTSSLE